MANNINIESITINNKSEQAVRLIVPGEKTVVLAANKSHIILNKQINLDSKAFLI